jgi:1-acyl-sn-glycerol-3-phosphate acyltransferase
MLHRLWYGMLRLLARALFICMFRIRVYGRENIPDGGALLASNHQSYLDPILLGVGLPRELSYMARDDLFDRPLFNTLIRSLNAFPVRKNAADRNAIREAVRRISEGGLVAVFPEGTRNDSGQLMQIQGGIAVIAKKVGCPIVPVAILGARDAWPRRFGIFHFWPIKVRFGPPLEVGGKTIEEITEDIEIGIGHLMEKLT